MCPLTHSMLCLDHGEKISAWCLPMQNRTFPCGCSHWLEWLQELIAAYKRLGQTPSCLSSYSTADKEQEPGH